MTREECLKKMEPYSFIDQYGHIMLYIPSEDHYFSLSFGNGSNLDGEDMENGYVDYLYIEIYTYYYGFEDYDGGMLLLKEEDVDKYGYDITKAVYDALEFMYGDGGLDFIPLIPN